jgi:hypothetical protein
MFENADIYEVVWTTIAGSGFVVAVYYAFDSHRDRLAQIHGRGGAAAVGLATAQMINAANKALAFFLYFCLGLYLTQTPPPTEAMSRAGLVIRLVLIFGQLFFFAGMTYTQIIRKRVLDAEEQREQRALLEATKRLKENTTALNDLTGAIQQATVAVEGETNGQS